MCSFMFALMDDKGDTAIESFPVSMVGHQSIHSAKNAGRHSKDVIDPTCLNSVVFNL